MAFGKQGGVYFSEQDESLATLISNQAVASIETTWLYQQLSNAFNTTTRLYDLSNAILKTEKLSDAASAVVEAAFKLGHSKVAGIVLFNPQKEIEAQVQIDAEGIHPGHNHPTDLIKQALINNSTATDVKGQIATVCLPLATPHRQYGVLWLRIPEVQWLNQRYSDDLQTLSNQAALALERGILLVETQQQREQIQSAYRELEITYDQTLIALSAAVDARDQETEGHSVRVSKLTYRLGKHLGLPNDQLKSLERGALLHDIGKIGISDNILLKPGPLTQEEWYAMRQHPDLGAKLIEGIPFLQDAIPVIRYHQERWDGSGYPVGMKGEDIPLEARVFAVADVFDALTSTRPYRQRVTINEAVRHLRDHAGIEFDPQIVDILEELALEGEINEYLTP
jgi:putative nucleotidyltransferase with HDIG domain